MSPYLYKKGCFADIKAIVFNRQINSNDGAEVRVRPVSSRETPPIPCTGELNKLTNEAS